MSKTIMCIYAICAAIFFAALFYVMAHIMAATTLDVVDVVKWGIGGN